MQPLLITEKHIYIEIDDIFKVTVTTLLKGKSNSAGSNYFLYWKVWIFHHRRKRISGRFRFVPSIQDYTQCRDPLSMLLPLSFYSVNK